MTKPLLIFLGSGLGGLLRYWAGGLVQNWWGPTFPVGTLVINVTGCFAIGFLAAAFEGPFLVRDDLKAAVLIGVLGGYTTFSSFSRETLALAHDGEQLRALLYVLLSVALSLGAVWAAAALAHRLYGAGSP